MPLLLFCEFLTQWSTSFTATDFEGREEEEERISCFTKKPTLKNEKHSFALALLLSSLQNGSSASLSNAASLKATTFKERREKNLNYVSEQTSKILGFLF